MQIVYNSTGTHTHKDQLKVRMDLYPESTDKSYASHYVYVPVYPAEGHTGKVDKEGAPVDQKAYDKWVASLPHIWQLNPCLSVFIAVGQDITKTLLTEYLNDVYKSDVLATIDDSLIQSNAAHLISPYCRTKTKLSTAKTLTFDDQIKVEVDTLLSGLSIVKESIGTIESIKAESIDVGSAAIDRAGALGFSGANETTIVDGNNAANADGTIDTVEMWFSSAAGGNSMRLGIFTASGNVLSCTDAEVIGEKSSGSKQTATGLDLDIATGQYIGIDETVDVTCYIERDTDGYTQIWYEFNKQLCYTGSSDTYTYAAGDAVSLYGTGTESGGGTTEVANTLQAIWSVRQAVSDTLNPQWSVRQSVSDTLQSIWSVRSATSNSVQAIWSVRQAVSDTIQAIWSVRSLTSKTLQTVWAVRQSVSQSLQSIWDVRESIAQSLQSIWSVRSLTAKALELVWDVEGVLTVVSNTLQLIWSVRQTSTQTLEAKWSVRSLISQSLQSIWSVRSLVTGSLQSIWSVRSTVSDALQAVWSVRTSTSNSLDVRWSVRGLVSQAVGLVWGVRASISKALQAVWNVSAAVATITKSLQIKWSVRSTVSNSLVAIWKVAISRKGKINPVSTHRSTLGISQPGYGLGKSQPKYNLGNSKDKYHLGD